MPDPCVNLLNIPEAEFKREFMGVLIDLIVNNQNNSKSIYYIIRIPEYTDYPSMFTSLSDLNISCSSLYEYWFHVNTFNGRTNVLYNYQEIITQVRDYLDYPEIRTKEYKSIEYSFNEIINLVIDNFKFYTIKFVPEEFDFQGDVL